MKVKLGDITKIKTGKLDANAASDDGEYPFFTCSRDPLKISSYSYDCECVLVAGNGDLNVKYYNGKFDAYQRTYIIEAKLPDVLYMPYLYFFMEKYVVELRKLAIGGVIKYIKLGNLTDALIELPSYEQQRTLVERLRKVKCSIDKRNEQLAKLDELVKCRFVELFGDAKNNPYGWVSETVDSVVEEIIGGVSVSGEARKIQKGELAVLKVSAVTYGVFKCDEYKVISNDIKLGKYVSPKKGDLLFSRANTKELVGATALVDKDYPHLLLPDKIWKIVVSDKVSPVYLKAYLSEPWIRELMSKVATGTSGSMYNISMEKLRQIPVILPPIERQNAFSTFVHRIDKLRFIVEDNLSFLSLVGAFCIVEEGDKSEWVYYSLIINTHLQKSDVLLPNLPQNSDDLGEF